ncbi:MAG: nuclear transport factor 2 family protein [Acidimicrobiales bacterium]
MSTDDIIAIQQLLARANTAVDAGDGAAYAACFTADGVLDAGEAGRFSGTEEIAAAGGSFATAIPGLRHWVNNHAIDVDGDRATATVYVVVVLAGAPPTLSGSGIYRDHMVRTDHGWLFESRMPVMEIESSPLSIPT